MAAGLLQRWFLVGLTAATMVSCGYAAHTRQLRTAIDAGDVDHALSTADTLVRRAEGGEGPYAENLPLFLMERGALLQAAGEHQAAVADFSDADQMLEVLDLTVQDRDAFTSYMWSESDTLYRAPLYEKLMVNVLAIASYLTMDDVGGAQVEARRIRVLADYYQHTAQASHPFLPVALYFGGLAMEAAGSAEAARFYQRSEDLGGPAAPDASDDHTLVLVSLYGLAPRREALILPLADALTVSVNQGANYTPEEQARIREVQAEALLTTVHIPVLVDPVGYSPPLSATVDGQPVALARVADVGRHAHQEWDQSAGQIIGAAIVRTVTRALVREALQATGRAINSDGEHNGAEAIFMLLSLLTQGAMVAADVPDTRGWTTMPRYIDVARLPLEAGSHTVTWSAGERETLELDSGTRVRAMRALR